MPLTYIYMTAHYPGLIGTGISIKINRFKLVLWAQTSLLNEMMQSCKVFSMCE
jgi:hypothetical protein